MNFSDDDYNSDDNISIGSLGEIGNNSSSLALVNKKNESTKSTKETMSKQSKQDRNSFSTCLIAYEERQQKKLNACMLQRGALDAELPVVTLPYDDDDNDKALTKILSRQNKTCLFEQQLIAHQNLRLTSLSSEFDEFTEEEREAGRSSGLGDGFSLRISDGTLILIKDPSGRIFQSFQAACKENNISIGAITHPVFLSMKGCFDKFSGEIGLDNESSNGFAARLFDRGFKASRKNLGNLLAVEVTNGEGVQSYHFVGRTIAGCRIGGRASRSDYSHHLNVFGQEIEVVMSYIQLRDKRTDHVLFKALPWDLGLKNSAMMSFLIGKLGATYQLVKKEALNAYGGNGHFTGLSCKHGYDPTTRPFLGDLTNLVVEKINEPIACDEIGLVNDDETTASVKVFVATVTEMVNERNEVDLEIIPHDERRDPVKKKKTGQKTRSFHYCKARVDGEDCDMFRVSTTKYSGMCARHKTLFDEREVSTFTPNSDESESEGEEDPELADEKCEKENDEMNSPKKKKARR